MCEPSDPFKVLNGIPFRVAALAQMMEKESYAKSVADSVYIAVRADIEYAVKQLKAEAESKTVASQRTAARSDKPYSGATGV